MHVPSVSSYCAMCFMLCCSVSFSCYCVTCFYAVVLFPAPTRPVDLTVSFVAAWLLYIYVWDILRHSTMEESQNAAPPQPVLRCQYRGKLCSNARSYGRNQKLNLLCEYQYVVVMRTLTVAYNVVDWGEMKFRNDPMSSGKKKSKLHDKDVWSRRNPTIANRQHVDSIQMMPRLKWLLCL